MKKTTLLLALLLTSSCRSVWVGGGTGAELGALSRPVVAGAGLEASVSTSWTAAHGEVGGRLVQAPAGLKSGKPLEGHDPADPGADDILGRLGFRWDVLDFAHAGAGVDTEARAYLRAGIERTLSRGFAIGLEGVGTEDGACGYLTLRWSR